MTHHVRPLFHNVDILWGLVYKIQIPGGILDILYKTSRRPPWLLKEQKIPNVARKGLLLNNTTTAVVDRHWRHAPFGDVHAGGRREFYSTVTFVPR